MTILNTMTNPIYLYDVTLPEEAGDPRSTLKMYCKHWCYQLEEGSKTGYRHYQIRLSLKDKMRLTKARELLPKGRWSPTHDSKSMNYVMKDDTRVLGPWSDKDPYIPKQVRMITKLRDWQQTIVDSATRWDPRTINLVVDSVGNHGKTTLAMYIACYKIGRRVPYTNSYKDLMRMVMGMPKTSLYIIDLPRGLDKSNMIGMWAGIEDLKNGHLWDDRYEWKEEFIDSPAVWVFTNEAPSLDCLSMDRWKHWRFVDESLQALALEP